MNAVSHPSSVSGLWNFSERVGSQLYDTASHVPPTITESGETGSYFIEKIFSQATCSAAYRRCKLALLAVQLTDSAQRAGWGGQRVGGGGSHVRGRGAQSEECWVSQDISASAASILTTIKSPE